MSGVLEDLKPFKSTPGRKFEGFGKLVSTSATRFIPLTPNEIWTHNREKTVGNSLETIAPVQFIQKSKEIIILTSIRTLSLLLTMDLLGHHGERLS